MITNFNKFYFLIKFQFKINFFFLTFKLEKLKINTLNNEWEKKLQIMQHWI